MKFTYMGFSQKKLVEYKLDLIDAAILRYFIDFKDSGSMVREIVKDEVYYWVKYELFISDNPIFNIKSKDALRKRFKKLTDANMLVHYHKKAGGSYSFYGVGENYKELIAYATTQKSEGAIDKSEGCDSKVGGGTIQKLYPYDSKVGTKDTSIKDSSIKNTHLLKHTQEDKKEIEKIVCVLDKKINASEAKKLLGAAGGDVDLIKEKYEIAKKTNYKNLMPWMISAIRDNYGQIIEQKDKPRERKKINTGFHNFEQRTSQYTPEQLKEIAANKRKEIMKC